MIIKKFNESSVDSVSDILKRNLDNVSIGGYGSLEYSDDNIKLLFSDETMKIINWGIEKLSSPFDDNFSSNYITMSYEIMGDTNLISIEIPTLNILSTEIIPKVRTLKVDDSLVNKLKSFLESLFKWINMVKVLHSHYQLTDEIITEIFSDLFDDNECGVYSPVRVGASHEVAISLGNRNSEIINASIFSNIENSINHLKNQFDVRVTIDISTPGTSYYKGMSSEFYNTKAIILKILMNGSQNWM